MGSQCHEVNCFTPPIFTANRMSFCDMTMQALENLSALVYALFLLNFKKYEILEFSHLNMKTEQIKKEYTHILDSDVIF